jgi:tetratricopeptide (TPR) repeat protein
MVSIDSAGPPAPEPARARRDRAPLIRSGAVPALADGFNARLETATGLAAVLAPGGTVVLVPGKAAAPKSLGWTETSGKTQLAACVAESLWRSGKVELLIWIVAASRASVLSGYVEAAVDITGIDPVGAAESVAARFISWLGETTRPWLVVLDDLSDVADLEGLWPAGPAGRVLITTANSAAFPGDHGELVYQVGPFSPREALSYLMGRLTADPDQRMGAIDLVQDLGNEPMALAQASAVIATSALSCRDYRDHFLRRRDQLTAGAADSEPSPSSVTWTISVEQAERLSPGGTTQAVLALAALLDGHGIPGAVFAAPSACAYIAAGGGNGGGAAPADRERAYGALLVTERTGLLSTDLAGAKPMVRMSRVIQAAIRGAMPEAMLDAAARAAAGALLEVWQGDDQPAWLAERLRSCAASLQESAGDRLWAGGCHPLLLRAGQSLDSARLTGPAVAYWREIAASCDRILGRGHPDTLLAGEHLAQAYLAAGRPAEAVSWFRWVVAERGRALGADHPDTIAAQHDLGRAMVAADQFGDAVSVLDAVVGASVRTRGADQLETLNAQDELAAAYSAAKKFDSAIRLYRSTLAERERLQGRQHPDVMSTRQKLGDAYKAAGDLKNALSAYKRVLSDRERVLGPSHLDTIAARGSLGAAYHSAGRMANALQLYEQTRKGYERALGPDHPETLARCAKLAHAYYSVGRVTDGLTLLRDTLARCERGLPPGDPLTEAVRESLVKITG